MPISNKSSVLHLYKRLYKYGQQLVHTDKDFYFSYVRKQFANADSSQAARVEFLLKVRNAYINRVDFIHCLLLTKKNLHRRASLSSRRSDSSSHPTTKMSKSVIRTLRELKTLPSALSQRCQYSSSDANQSTPPKVCKGAKPEELGQPSFATHPHLFAPSTTLSVPFALSAAECSKQVTPFITKQELEQRRHAYVDYLSAYQSFYFSTKLSRREKANKAADVANLKHLAADEDHNFIALIPAATLTYMAPVIMWQ